MKRIRNDFSVLNFTVIAAVVLVVLSSLFWTSLQYTTITNNSPYESLLYYGVFVLLLIGTTFITYLIDDTPRQRFIPRIHLLVAAAAWLTAVVGATLSSNVVTVYFLKLLEAPLLFLLLTLAAWRIWQSFLPNMTTRWLIASTAISTVITALIAPSTLNVAMSITAGRAMFTHGVGYQILVALGFILVTISIVLIPFGRRTYQSHPTISVGPLLFTTPATAQDANLPPLIDLIVHTYRRQALKRGQWIHYRNYLHSERGIISTEPKSCTNVIMTLIEYALHKNQTRAISIVLYNDTRHPYLHCQITYTVNTHAKKEFVTFAQHITAIGGHLSVDRNGRETLLTITFPRQW